MALFFGEMSGPRWWWLAGLLCVACARLCWAMQPVRCGLWSGATGHFMAVYRSWDLGRRRMEEREEGGRREERRGEEEEEEEEEEGEERGRERERERESERDRGERESARARVCSPGCACFGACGLVVGRACWRIAGDEVGCRVTAGLAGAAIVMRLRRRVLGSQQGCRAG